MPLELKETRLPGVGVKWTMTPAAGSRITVILHDDEARQLGALLGGAYERPKIVEELEMALGEFQIEWIKVPNDSWVNGRTLADCGFRKRTGVATRARPTPSSSPALAARAPAAPRGGRST